MQTPIDNRQGYREAGVRDFARRLLAASRRGIFGPDIRITDMQTVAGPRAGAILIFAGLETGTLHKSLSASGAALPLALLPEEFVGRVHVYRHESDRRFLRVEAPWVRSLQVHAVPLHRMTQRPHAPGAWTVGVDEYGRFIRASLNTGRTPHYLIAGTTGAGKTESIIAFIVQTAATPARHNTRMVIIDGKRGRLLARRNAERLPGNLRNLVGPIATTPDDWRAAALWCEQTMEERLAAGFQGKLIVVIDELPEVIRDPLIKEAIKRMATLGRDVEVHIIATVQHPTVENVGGNALLRCLVGRVGFLVTDSVASRVVVGGPEPRLDNLHGEGDGYAMAPQKCFRILGPLVTSETIARMSGDIFGDPEMPEWPEAQAETLGRTVGRPSPWPTGAQMGLAMICAESQIGRTIFTRHLQADQCPERTTNRLRNMLKLAKSTIKAMGDKGWTLAGPPLDPPDLYAD